MRKKAWAFQVKSQIEKHGKKKASWYVGWLTPEGKRRRKSCGPGTTGKRLAVKMVETIHAQLIAGTYEDENRQSWSEFRRRYDERVLAGKSANSRRSADQSLRTFERIAKVKFMRSINTEMIDQYVAKRKREKGRFEGTTVSPATINRELRYIRAALRKAKAWRFIDTVPEITFQKTPEKMPTYVPADHFGAIYAVAGAAQRPSNVANVDAADWWRALLVTAYLTGWRISQILALRWDDVDLEKGVALSHAMDNKGKRDERLPLHPVIVDHLRKLAGSFQTYVFPWDHAYRGLWDEFWRIQESAELEGGKPLPKCGKNGWYGFHDLRRGFATENAAGMNLFELQALMQHRSLETTRRYVSMANRLNRVVANLKVPDVLDAAARA